MIPSKTFSKSSISSPCSRSSLPTWSKMARLIASIDAKWPSSRLRNKRTCNINCENSGIFLREIQREMGKIYRCLWLAWELVTRLKTLKCFSLFLSRRDPTTRCFCNLLQAIYCIHDNLSARCTSMETLMKSVRSRVSSRLWWPKAAKR